LSHQPAQKEHTSLTGGVTHDPWWKIDCCSYRTQSWPANQNATSHTTHSKWQHSGTLQPFATLLYVEVVHHPKQTFFCHGSVFYNSVPCQFITKSGFIRLSHRWVIAKCSRQCCQLIFRVRLCHLSSVPALSSGWRDELCLLLNCDSLAQLLKHLHRILPSQRHIRERRTIQMLLHLCPNLFSTITVDAISRWYCQSSWQRIQFAANCIEMILLCKPLHHLQTASIPCCSAGSYFLVLIWRRVQDLSVKSLQNSSLHSCACCESMSAAPTLLFLGFEWVHLCSPIILSTPVQWQGPSTNQTSNVQVYDSTHSVKTMLLKLCMQPRMSFGQLVHTLQIHVCTLCILKITCSCKEAQRPSNSNQMHIPVSTTLCPNKHLHCLHQLLILQSQLSSTRLANHWFFTSARQVLNLTNASSATALPSLSQPLLQTLVKADINCFMETTSICCDTTSSPPACTAQTLWNHQWH